MSWIGKDTIRICECHKVLVLLRDTYTNGMIKLLGKHKNAFGQFLNILDKNQYNKSKLFNFSLADILQKIFYLYSLRQEMRKMKLEKLNKNEPK